MIANGESIHDDIFQDYGVKGNVLSRPGLDALIERVRSDLFVSHIFIPRRDRLARPDDPLDGMAIETELRRLGVTLVTMAGEFGPIRRSKRDMGDLLVAMLDYHQAGKERRDLAQKIIHAQLALAKQGFSTGGRPPFGFRRWLVNQTGQKVRQLTDGEHVKMAGHHVVWLPGPESELMLIRRILDMLKYLPASRVAASLTAEGIPTPDAGRFRTDHGHRHCTSGIWHGNTITNIARNPLILATVEYGRRSEGDVLRSTPTGPRKVEDDERIDAVRVRVVVNPETDRIRANGQFEPIVDPKQHKLLLKELDRRGGSQRGMPKSRRGVFNPLGGRVYDLNCGWPMYRQPYGQGFRYLCGYYQQSHAAKCTHHHVDGLKTARFLLSAVRQRLSGGQARDRIEARLRVLSARASNRPTGQDHSKARIELTAVETELQLVAENLARARDRDQYDAVERVFRELTIKKENLLAVVQNQTAVATAVDDPGAEIQKALCRLDRIQAELGKKVDGDQAGTIFALVNAKLFLGFKTVIWNNRKVNRLTRVQVTFGTQTPPVDIYDGPTSWRQVSQAGNQNRTASFAAEIDQNSQITGGEGDRSRNANRGERI